MKQRNRLSFTTRYVLAFGIILLTANILLGIVILNQSKTAMRSLINKDMLDVVNSAAALIDGDALGSLTAEDVGGEVFNDVAQKLTAFQDSVDIRFIYAVKQAEDGRFVFTVDPDPVDPGEFGEEVLVTEALVRAGEGVSTVDDAPAADRWGNFYSAYSPVRDSSGQVAGIIGIDFDANWYDAEVRHHTVVISVVTFLSVLIGGIVVFLITRRVSRRFRELDGELSDLSNDMDRLMEKVVSIANFAPQGVQPGEAQSSTSADELEVLGEKIHNMRDEIVVYLDYLHTQAYTDALTGVGNATGYHEMIRRMDEAIQNGTADFSVGVFDVNSLKQMNDQKGHEYGDLIIVGAATAIAEAFGRERTFRIGGDEFAAVVENGDDVEARMAAVDAGIETFNFAHASQGVALAVSKGMARFNGEEDASFARVFSRADQEMYRNKKAYYETVGNRRETAGEPSL